MPQTDTHTRRHVKLVTPFIFESGFKNKNAHIKKEAAVLPEIISVFDPCFNDLYRDMAIYNIILVFYQWFFIS